MKLPRRHWLSAFAALVITGGAVATQTAWASDPSPTAEEAAAAASLTKAAYLRDPDAPVAGNPDGNLTVIEFFDYQCPYCRAMHSDLKRFLAEDPKIRFVFKDWPIFGDVSVYAARLALAARWQDKYLAVHDALMTTPGKLDKAKVREAAKTAGVDLDRLDQDLAARAAEIDVLLARNKLQAHGIALAGTPGFIIDQFFTLPGAVDLATLKAKVAEARLRAPAGG